jgi:hypothetical protein
MAGQPRKRAVIAELERRAAQDDSTVLEYAEAWVAGGGTLFSLAKSVQKSLWPEEAQPGLVHRPPPRATVERYLFGLEEGAEQRLLRARSSSGSAMAEESVELADADYDKDGAPRVKNQIQARQWLAQRFNKELAEQKGPSVAISIGSLHLAALRQRASAVATLAPGPSAVDNGATAHQIEEAQVVDAQGDSSE